MIYGLAPVELGFCHPPNVADKLMFVVTLGEIKVPNWYRVTVPDKLK